MHISIFLCPLCLTYILITSFNNVTFGGDEIPPITTGVGNPKAGEVGALPIVGVGGWGVRTSDDGRRQKALGIYSG